MDIWAVIAEERVSLIETFEHLEPDQWDVPSLCGHWTVQQILGHLVVATDPPIGRFFVEVAKAFGSFDKANDRLALAQSERPLSELIADLRNQVSSQFSPPGLGPAAPLHDVLLHSLDVRVPLGLPTDRPAERYVPAMELVLSTKGIRTLVAKGRPALRWVATDHTWSGGSGDEVQGRMADLTMAASGRGARVDAITGKGQAALAVWLNR